MIFKSKNNKKENVRLLNEINNEKKKRNEKQYQINKYKKNNKEYNKI